MTNIIMRTNGNGWVDGDKGFISGWVMDSLDVAWACIMLDSGEAICAQPIDFTTH